MNQVNLEISSNTYASGKVIYGVMLLSCFALSAANLSPSVNIPSYNIEPSSVTSESTSGSGDYTFKSDRQVINYYKLRDFLKTFINDSEDIPPNINKIFREKMWELLA
ncbi:MAG: hypothetical protein PVG30_04155 [Gammaproteobacteria bacterium]|jgi:hypothetical protein